jgi:hemolysin activation/secretion protein
MRRARTDGSLKLLSRVAPALLLLALDDALAQAALPQPSPTEQRALGARVRIARIELEGAGPVDPAAIEALTAPYVGRMADTGDLRALVDAITENLQSRGYVGSRAELPDQELTDGVVRVRIVLAHLTAVRISPSTFWNREIALRAWLLPHGEEVLHIPTLQDRLALLRESGLVERVNAEVLPFDARGATYAVVLAVEESQPFRAGLSYANNRSPGIGAKRAELALLDRSVVGLGDVLDARLGRTEGLDDWSASYRVPIPRTPIAFFASRVRSDSLAIEPAFRALDITAVADTDTGGVEWALVKTTPVAAVLRYAYDKRTTRTYLLGIPFSFVPGILDGVGMARVHRISAEAVRRSQDWSASARLQFSKGTTNADTSEGPLSAARDFSAVALSGAWVHQLPGQWGQLRTRLDSQYTRDRLFPFERMAIGGASTVRGYRENLLLRDIAAIASAEWRTRDYSPWSEQVVASAGLFVDAGWGRNAKDAQRDGPATIASVGLSLQVQLFRYVAASVAWALPSKRNLTPHDDLQDRGVHWAIGVTFP